MYVNEFEGLLEEHLQLHSLRLRQLLHISFRSVDHRPSGVAHGHVGLRRLLALDGRLSRQVRAGAFLETSCHSRSRLVLHVLNEHRLAHWACEAAGVLGNPLQAFGFRFILCC